MSGYTVIYAYNLPRLRNIGWMASRTYVVCGIQFSSTFFKLITVKREKMQKTTHKKQKTPSWATHSVKCMLNYCTEQIRL